MWSGVMILVISLVKVGARCEIWDVSPGPEAALDPNTRHCHVSSWDDMVGAQELLACDIWLDSPCPSVRSTEYLLPI